MSIRIEELGIMTFPEASLRWNNVEICKIDLYSLQAQNNLAHLKHLITSIN